MQRRLFPQALLFIILFVSGQAWAADAPVWQPMPLPEPVPVTEGYADLPGVRLWYWDTGGDGEVILLAHPGSQSSQIWGYQQPVFAAAGYRVIAYSRRGHYRSEAGTDAGSAVADLVNLLDYLDVEKAHLVGAAAGGISTMAFATWYPERTLSLVLASSIVSPDEQEWRDMFSRLDMNIARQHMSPEFMELSASYRAGNPEGTALFEEFGHDSSPNGRVSQAVGVTVNWRTMESLPVPVLLLTGEADLYAPPSLIRLFAGHLSGSEQVYLREAGHAAYWEQPEAFNHIVLDFIGRHGEP